MPPETRPVLVIGCGALAREIAAVSERNRLAIDVTFLPARYHNTPDRIPSAVERRIVANRHRYDHIFVAYGDCGTGGELDRVLARHDIERLAGAHCYEFFAGGTRFQAMHDSEPTTFYLTDFLVRHFDRLVWRGLGLDRWPHLLADYFGNYTRVVYLAQLDDPDLTRQAAEAAARLGLEFEREAVGYGDLETALMGTAGGT